MRTYAVSCINISLSCNQHLYYILMTFRIGIMQSTQAILNDSKVFIMKQHHYAIFINDILPYLENSRLHSSVVSIPQCSRDLQMQQFVVEFYCSLQRVKCQQKINNQSKFAILTFVFAFTSTPSSIK